MLQIRNLTVNYGAISAVRGIDLTVGAGEVVGLVGQSGSGKSLTALSILGLAPAAARVQGRIRFAGRSLEMLSERELLVVLGLSFYPLA